MSHDRAPWIQQTRERVEARLSAFLEDKRKEAQSLGPESSELVDVLADLTLRGGKRLRAAVIDAAFHSVAEDADPRRTTDAGAAIELLQSYLLIHDDWMDLDEERRNGPSAHAILRDRHGDAHMGASLAILAGDLGCAYASELISACPFPHSRVREGLGAFWQLHREVVLGQHLDVVCSPDVERMYDLKTGSYTVRGPVMIGAILGDANEHQMRALRGFAAPLGIAFQLRDELLDTFGDSQAMGKPTGSDLRSGKLTTLVAHARRSVPEAERRPLERVFGEASASDDAVGDAARVLEGCGARAAVEERLESLVSSSLAALEDASLVTDRLRTLVRLLAHRDR